MVAPRDADVRGNGEETYPHFPKRNDPHRAIWRGSSRNASANVIGIQEERGNVDKSPPHSLERRVFELRVWEVLDTVLDPEIPVLSIVDLGIVRSVQVADDGAIEIGVSPTYSGCPATEVIRAHIEEALERNGMTPYRVRDVLSPPWSSDWITAAGREKLLAYGIAPPEYSVSKPRHLLSALRIACPRCKSEDTELVSEFGSTPCKSLRRCRTCLEPFEQFKCI